LRHGLLLLRDHGIAEDNREASDLKLDLLLDLRPVLGALANLL